MNHRLSLQFIPGIFVFNNPSWWHLQPLLVGGLLYCLLLQSMPMGWIAIAPPSESLQTQEQPKTKPIQLQYTSAGHVLGFGAGQVVVGSRTHALTITLAQAATVDPMATAEHSRQNEITLSNIPKPLRQKANVFTGCVRYLHPWPKVSVVFRAQPGAIVKSEYQIEAGSTKQTISQISIRYNRPVEVDKTGGLLIKHALGNMCESAPVAWQEINQQRVSVKVKFRKREAQEVGFEVGHYNSHYALVIDPSLTWNTFVGSGTSENDYGYGIAVDSSGNTYMTGYSDGPWGSVVRGYSGGQDAYAAKLDSNGNLVWTSFLGGAGGDNGNAIAVDGSGNVYVGGISTATWGVPVDAYSSGDDTFAAKLNSSGALLWNTFLGGAGSDNGKAIAVDGGGNVYVGGYSNATWEAPVRAYSSGNDAFAVKLDSGGALLWNTFLGGAGNDDGPAIAVDGSGNLYVGGNSSATWGGPVRGFSGGFRDAFAAKINSSGVLQWNTFLGGTTDDLSNAIAVDGGGDVYVGGYSNSVWGAPVRGYSSGTDMFAAKLNSSGALQWNTFLGGAGDDYGHALAVDVSGDLYVCGESDATWGVPIRAFTGGADAYAAKLNNSGVLSWNTFLGGAGIDYGKALVVNTGGNVYVGGNSNMTWGAPVRGYNNGGDAYAAKLDSNGMLLWNTFLGSAGIDDGQAIALDGSGNVYMVGQSTASWGAPVRAYSNGFDTFAVKLNSSGVLMWNTFLGDAGTDYGQAIALDSSGNVYVGGHSDATWGAPLRAFSSGIDAYTGKLNTSGVLLWNEFLGGAGTDVGQAITVDNGGIVYVGGYSTNTWGAPLRAYGGAKEAFVVKIDDAFAVSKTPTPTATLMYSPTSTPSIPAPEFTTRCYLEKALVNLTRGEKIVFHIEFAESQTVAINVYDLKGCRWLYRQETIPGGCHEIVWDGGQAGAGLYLVYINCAEGAWKKKIVLIR